MKTNFQTNILILTSLLFFLLDSIYNVQIENKKKDLSVELDDKLSELYNYYQNIIHSNEEEKGKKKSAGEIGKNVKKNETDIKGNIMEEYSFIQTKSKETAPNEDSDTFLFQPYVWTEYPGNKEIPSERRGHSAVLADTFMIIFGGCYMDSKCYNELYFFNLRFHQWKKISPSGKIPTPRQGHTAVMYGSVMWIFGGSSGEGYLSDLYSLDLETREWKQHYFANNRNMGRSGHSAVMDDDGKIIIFGGYSERGYMSDIMVINTKEERFEYPLATGTPPTPRETFSMELINNRIYLFGGFQEGGVLNDSYSIDLLTWTWIKLETQGPNPPARQAMACTRVGKKIYITGGCDFRQQKCYTDTYILDTDSLWWSKIENNKSDLTGRGGFTLIFFRGHLFTFGGCELYKRCFNNVFVMNINEICPNKCSGKGVCKEKVGCQCNPTFVSHDCSRRIKCRDNCNNNGICHNNGNCACYPGWSGVVCNTQIPCPKNCTNTDNGVCQSNGECKCKPGFAGTDCSEYTIIGKDTPTPDNYQSLIAIKSKPADINLISVNSTKTRVNNARDGPKEDDGEDVEEEDKKEEATSEKQKLEINNINMFKIGPNSDVYYKTDDCRNNCTQRGMCLNSTCFCQQGFTYNDCSFTYQEYLEWGVSLKDMSKFIFISFGSTFIITLIVLLARSSQKIAGDHIELDASK